MNFNQIKFGKPVTYLDGVVNYLKGAMIWGFRSKYKWSQTTPDIWGFANPTDIDPEATAIYNRIIADGGVSNLTRLNYFVVGLKTIYATLDNVPVCYDAHWIGYKLGSGTGATAGQAAAKLYSLTVAGDAVQATAASQPLLLAHNGASSDNYWWGSGVSGNYVRTPNGTANSNNGDKEIIAKIDITNLTNQVELVNKDDVGSNRSWRIFITSTRFITVFAATDLSTYTTNAPTSDVALPVNFIGFLKTTFSFTGGNLNVIFSISSDGITYTQLGTQRSKSGNNLINTGSELAIGIVPNIGVSDKIKIYRVTLANSIGGAPVVDFNPATYNASTSQTQWTSATGEVWTINTGTATTGYKGTIVDRVIVMSDGVDDNMISTVNRANLLTQYLAVKPYINDNTVDRTVIDANGTSFQNSISLTSSLFYYVLNGFGGSKAISNTINTLQILAAISNAGVKNSLSKNNSGEVSDTYTPTPSSNGIFVFGKGNGAANGKSNVILNTYIYINLADNLTIQTSTYNLLKTLNNL